MNYHFIDALRQELPPNSEGIPSGHAMLATRKKGKTEEHVVGPSDQLLEWLKTQMRGDYTFGLHITDDADLINVVDPLPVATFMITARKVGYAYITFALKRDQVIWRLWHCGDFSGDMLLPTPDPEQQ